MFSHGCEGDAARQRCFCPCAAQGGRGESSASGAARIKGDILFRKREYPLWNPKRKALIGSFGLERLLCLRNGTACARRCRVWICYTIWVTSTTRCRSADLVEVRTNFRLLGHSSMRRASAMPLFRTQSAAEVTSLAPHGSKARLKTVTNRRDSWRSHVHRTHTAQRVQSFKNKTRNVGGRGVPPRPSLGGYKGGILFEKRISPLTAHSHANGSPPSALLR